MSGGQDHSATARVDAIGGTRHFSKPGEGTLTSGAEACAQTSWSGYQSGLPHSLKFTAPWRQAVQRRWTMLFDELARLRLGEERSHTNAEEERRFLICTLLEDANQASQESVNLRKWWWGTEIERAWARLREVEERTIDLLPEDELLARAADASGHGHYYLKGDDQRLQHLDLLRLEAGKETRPKPPEGLRSSIVEVLRASHAQADRINQEARYLRNRLLIASGVSLVSAILLVLVQWRVSVVGFVAYPPGSTDHRAWVYLALVMLFGSVGALFTAIPAISNIPSDFGPFNLPLQQALLKIALGPIVAVVGLAILSTDALKAAIPSTWPGLLLLAVVFGAGQQAVTTYVDRRAKEILTSATPDKKRESS